MELSLESNLQALTNQESKDLVFNKIGGGSSFNILAKLFQRSILSIAGISELWRNLYV